MKRQLHLEEFFTINKAKKNEIVLAKEEQIIREPLDNLLDLLVIENDIISSLSKIASSSITLILTNAPCKEKDNYVKEQETIIKEIHRILTDDGSVCWCICESNMKEDKLLPLDIIFFQIFYNMGMTLKNRIVWRNNTYPNAKYNLILWFSKSEKSVFNLDSIRVPSKYPGKLHYKGKKIGKPSGNPLGKNPSDVWIDLDLGEAEGQLPACYIERCIEAFTNIDDTVLDVFCDNGLILSTCIKKKRKAKGIVHSSKFDLIKEYIFTLSYLFIYI